MKEDNCWEDTNYTMFKSTYCPDFTEPIFTGTRHTGGVKSIKIKLIN